MINVSNNFRKELASDNRRYLEYVNITLSNGTELNIKNKDLWSGGVTVEDATSSDSSFDIGSAIINQCTITINNMYDDYSEYVFENAKVSVYIGLELQDGTIERVQKGVFWVNEAQYNGSIITLYCLDNMSKFDRAYSKSTLRYPATLLAIVKDACSKCGVSLQTVSFPHDSFSVKERPSDEAITFREIISWAAQIAGCFCRCDANGRLEIKWYNQKALASPTIIDWSKDDASGPQNAHWIKSNYSAPVVSADDVVVTGVKVTEKNESEESGNETVTYQSGSDGYVIGIEDNELVKNGSGQTVAGWLGEQLIGVRFRKASVNHASDPTIEAGDIAVITDSKGKSYNIVVSSTSFTTGGAQNTISAAETPARNSADRYSAATKNYVLWRQAIEKEKTEREKQLEVLGEKINNSQGAFTTVEEKESGGRIYYLHNKPVLSESDMMWKMTAEAWAVSTDGGKTWNAGMTVDGDTIVRILAAVGINADWINTGAISIIDNNGKRIFYADVDTKEVVISGEHVTIGSESAEKAINSANETAQNALNSAAAAKNMTMQLSNDYQSITVDNSGNYTKFPSCTTTAQVMYGSENVTEKCSFSVGKSDSITGSWDATTKKYTVTGLSADSGWVDISATYLGKLTVLKRFTVAKLYAGAKGDPGDAGTVYKMNVSTTMVKIAGDRFHNPKQITASTYYRSGSSTQWISYKCRIKIEGNDGSSWTTLYTSSENESNATIHIDSIFADNDGSLLVDNDGSAILAVPRDFVSIRFSMYAPGGTTILIDTAEVPILKAVEDLTQEEVFNLLTNNGAAKGLYMDGNQLYISFSYAHGGTLGLGGVNNGNGILRVYDETGAVVGSWTKDGINAKKGTFSGDLSGASGTFKGELTAGKVTGSEITGSSFETKNDSSTQRIRIEKASEKFYSEANYSTYAGEIHPNTLTASIQETNSTGEIVMHDEEVSGLDINANYLARILVRNKEMLRLESELAKINKRLSVSGALSATGNFSTGGTLTTNGAATIGGKITGTVLETTGSGINKMNGSLIVTGTISQGVITTQSAEQKVVETYASASPSPEITDAGAGETSEDGVCYVSLDETYISASSDTAEYIVFLQEEGEGKLYVAEKGTTYFIVRGTKNLKFAWKIQSIKSGGEIERYADLELKTVVLDEEVEFEVAENQDLLDIAAEELAMYDKEREEI